MEFASLEYLRANHFYTQRLMSSQWYGANTTYNIILFGDSNYISYSRGSYKLIYNSKEYEIPSGIQFFYRDSGTLYLPDGTKVAMSGDQLFTVKLNSASRLQIFRLLTE